MPELVPAGGAVAPTPDGGVRIVHGPDGVTHCEIARFARRNALSVAVLDALRAAIDECERRDQPVVVLRGERGFFSAGADLSEITGDRDDLVWFERMAALVARLRSSPVVSIAVLEGACIGAGLELATACDLRIAGPACVMAIPALQMGLVYRPDAVARLSALAGPAVAARLLLLGDRLTAEQAYDAGVVTVVCEEADPSALVERIAAALARTPHETLGATARLLSSLTDGSYDPDAWLRTHLRSLESPVRRAAVAAKQTSTRK